MSNCIVLVRNYFEADGSNQIVPCIATAIATATVNLSCKKTRKILANYVIGEKLREPSPLSLFSPAAADGAFVASGF